eukprot:10952151-Alexandrium_andersonii.AAC.1
MGQGGAGAPRPLPPDTAVGRPSSAPPSRSVGSLRDEPGPPLPLVPSSLRPVRGPGAPRPPPRPTGQPRDVRGTSLAH